MIGKEYKTKEKYWKLDFQIAGDTGKGRCNFDYKSLEYNKPSGELRDQLRKGIVLYVWERRPKLIKVKVGEEEKTKVEIINNKITQEEKLLGILKMELNNWITEIGTKEWKGELYGKYKLYDPKLLQRPEFAHVNHSLWNAFTEKERKLFDEVVQRALASKPEGDKKPEDAKGAPDKPAKKEVAKGAPKKKPAKEGKQEAVEIEDIEAPVQEGYVILEKSYKTGANGYLQEKQRAKQEETKKKTEETKAGAAKKKEPTEEEKQKQKIEKKEMSLKRIEKYFDVVQCSNAGSIITKIRLNNVPPIKKKKKK